MKKFWLGLFLVLCFVKSSEAFVVLHEFDVFVGKFNASRTSFVYSINDEEYAVNSEVKTYGTFDVLYPFQAIYSTAGQILKSNELMTRSYKYSSKSRFNRRAKELVYDEDGKPLYRISSKNDKEKKTVVNQGLNSKGTTDLQTVFAELSLQYHKYRFCDSRMEVFDGKRRFDVVFKDEGQEELKANKYSNIEGKASKCSMYIDSLGNKGDDLLWEISSDRPINFWIMEYGENGRPFIARAEIDETPYGAVRVYTKKVKVEE